MKQSLFAFSLRKTLFLALFAMLAMGACKSKKKAVQPTPPPAPQEQVVQPAPAPAPARSAEEVAAEKLVTKFARDVEVGRVQ